MRSLMTILVLFMTIPAWAQTPCDGALPTGVILNPTTLYAELPEHTALLADGTASVTGYTYGFMVEGAASPTVEGAITKAAWSLAGGACYGTPVPNMGAVPIGQRYVAVLKAVRGGEVSAWSSPSNPFGRSTAPSVPTKLRLQR